MDYVIRCYYGKNYSGLAESMETLFEEVAIDYIWEAANKGYYVEVETPDGVERFTPDFVLEQYYEGELDISL